MTVIERFDMQGVFIQPTIPSGVPINKEVYHLKFNYSQPFYLTVVLLALAAGRLHLPAGLISVSRNWLGSLRPTQLPRSE